MVCAHTGITRSYLEQFARQQSSSDRKHKVWVYRRETAPFSSTPGKIGREYGYFAVTRSDGSFDETVEQLLWPFETEGAKLLRLFNYETFFANSRDVEGLLRYVALTFARTTARRGLTRKLSKWISEAYGELASDPVWLQQQVEEYARFSGVLASQEEISVATRKVLAKLSAPEYANNGFIQGLFQLAESLYRELQGKPWQIWEAPEPSQFITTDNPVVTLKSDRWGQFYVGWGFSTPGVTTFFPISPCCCLLIGAGVGIGARYWRRATAHDVSGINKALVMCMDRWAYSASRSEDIVWLVDHAAGSTRYGENIFVPSWMSDGPEDIKEKVRRVVSRGKIGSQAVATANLITKGASA